MDIIAKILSIPFFIMFFFMAFGTAFGRAKFKGSIIPYFSLKSLFLRLFAAFFTLVFYVIAIRLWG